ncbi:MAG TPA: thermonuclease family protein [Herpetosiphonaceae bacterium]
MPTFVLQHEPEHLALCDRAGWVSATDGDTPTIQLPVRMLGIDAPELHFGGADEEHPGKYDEPFANFLATHGANLDDGLKQHLAPRLMSQASTRHIHAGKAAHSHYLKIVRERLDRGMSQNGKPRPPRKLFVMVAEQIFDHNGRLLAYVNANYTKAERAQIPPAQRPTFNLQMMQDGHATSLLIYPNIPKRADLKLVQDAVRSARENGKGIWAQGDLVLQAFEFRWIIDTITGTRQGPDRFCGDVTTGKLFPPQQYYRVEPENRLFFFEADVHQALMMGFSQATTAEIAHVLG